MVKARPDDEVLQVQVARGTSVLDDHERALVELCSDPNLDGTETEECVLDYLKGGYDYSQSVSTKSEAVVNGADETNVLEEDDLVNNMYSMWAEDLPKSAPAAPATPSEKEPIKDKPKPWSSRSSPSGTFVRDPATGKMRNIDA